MKKYVITGGPGIGKTSVCKELKKLDYYVTYETARIIIAEERKKPNPVLPNSNIKEFQVLAFNHQKTLEESLNSNIAFLDRSVIDCIAYCNYYNIGVPDYMYRYTFNHRYERVFLLTPIPGYSKDEERLEDKETAINLHYAIWKEYNLLGYPLIHVPVLSPKERARFILRRI